MTSRPGDFEDPNGIVEKIQQNEARLQSILNVVPDAIITIEEKGAIASFNRAAERLFGYTAEEVIGQNVKMLMPSPFHEEHDGYLAHYKTTGEKKVIGIGREVQALRKDGSIFPINLAVDEILIGDKRLFTGVVHDLSELKDAQSLSNRLGHILDRSLNEFYIFDAETLRFVQVNYGARKNMGYSDDEFAQLTPVDIKPELSREQFEDLIGPVREGTEEVLRFETVHQRKDGSTYPVDISLQHMGSETPPVFAAIIRDISNRRTRREALLLRDRAIAELDVGVVIADAAQADNPIVFANPAIAKMSGYGIEEMLGRNPRFLQGDDRDQPEIEEIRTALAEKRPVNVLLRNYRKDGTLFMDEVAISPVRDDDGIVTHFVGLHRNVTLNLETEEKLRQSQKMEAIGQLTGGIAHDFNNLLTVILGNNELVASSLGDDARLQRLLGASTAAAERGAQLTGQLLSFARQQSLVPKIIDLNELVQEMAGMLGRTLGETCELSTVLAPDLGKTLADPVQVHNALLNLAINARDAMPDGGKLIIETSNVYLDTDAAKMQTDATPGQYVRLSVRDTGTGMSADVKARVLEPFFTTKEQGKGTGLGLSMVHGFAKQSGGHIEIYSELGHGTAISFYLPDANAAGEAKAQSKEPMPPDGTYNETILVVEDDPAVRDITVARLETLGYQIIEAETGQAALDLLGQGVKVDVMLTDMVMPGGMTGADLARLVRQKYPDIKVIFTSGYAEEGIMPSDGTPWLRKPYPIHELARTLRELLD